MLRKGPAPAIIADLARETGAAAVFWNEIAQAPHQAVAGRVAAALEAIGVVSQSFPGDLLVSPSDIRSKDGRGLRVFTPFWRRLQASDGPPKPVPAPNGLRSVPDIASDTLESWGLEPSRPDWTGGLRETWKPGEHLPMTAVTAMIAAGLSYWLPTLAQLWLMDNGRLARCIAPGPEGARFQ